MRRKTIKITILLTLISLLATGCWDDTPIEKYDITTTVVVDTAPGGYSFCLEIASLAGSGGNEESGGSAPKSRVLYGEGPSFVEARQELERQSDKPIYLSGVQCVIFTERMAYGGIGEYMSRFRQNPRYRKTAMAAVTGINPEDLFAAASENNTLVGSAVTDTLDSLTDLGFLYHMTMGDVLQIISCPCKGYLIPRIGLTGKEHDIEMDGFCVMDGDICRGIIPMEDGEFIVYTRGNAPPFHYAMAYNENSYTVEIRLRRTPVKVYYTDGKIRIDLSFTCKATLIYMDSGKTIEDTEMQDAEEKLERALEKEFTKVIRTSQEDFRIDYLKFHEEFRIHYPDVFKQIDWKEEYPKAQIKVYVDASLTGSNIDYEPEG